MRAFAFDGARILAFVTRQRRPWFVHLARRFDRVRGEAIDRRDELRRIPGDAGSGCGIDRICLGDEYVEGGAFVARERFDNGMTAVDDVDRRVRDELRPHVAAFSRNMRERAGNIEFGDRVGRCEQRFHARGDRVRARTAIRARAGHRVRVGRPRTA